MESNSDLVTFVSWRMREGKTPGEVKKEIRSAKMGWRGFEISAAIATALNEINNQQEENSEALQSIEEKSADAGVEATLERTEGKESFQTVKIDWPVLDIANTWGLLTAGAIFFIIVVSLVAIYLSL